MNISLALFCRLHFDLRWTIKIVVTLRLGFLLPGNPPAFPPAVELPLLSPGSHLPDERGNSADTQGAERIEFREASWRRASANRREKRAPTTRRLWRGAFNACSTEWVSLSFVLLLICAFANLFYSLCRSVHSVSEDNMLRCFSRVCRSNNHWETKACLLCVSNNTTGIVGIGLRISTYNLHTGWVFENFTP